MPGVLLAFLSVGELIGFLLIAFGLLRESFAALARGRPYGEGRYSEGAYGGGPTPIVERLLAIGKALRLLPRDRTLTAADRKRNAVLAIVGVVLTAGSMVAGALLT